MTAHGLIGVTKLEHAERLKPKGGVLPEDRQRLGQHVNCVLVLAEPMKCVSEYSERERFQTRIAHLPAKSQSPLAYGHSALALTSPGAGECQVVQSHLQVRLVPKFTRD